ncbi:hypothetical protein DDF62_14410 [Caulobacter radicis]|uniref:hypothetical protein n=1 Tax=Caulobacter radicis TaxID=2172650 RepID=UPI000D56367D|nr:hypothetical protein [Caulobacter radicis]PVM88387.1 hypothetical protein DDF62_14410 [Caulobacter radicis]
MVEPVLAHLPAAGRRIEAVFYCGSKSIGGQEGRRIDVANPEEAYTQLERWYGADALVVGSIAAEVRTLPPEQANLLLLKKNEEKLGAYALLIDILQNAGINTVLLKDVLRDCAFPNGRFLGREATPDELLLVEPVRVKARNSHAEQTVHLFGHGKAPETRSGDPATALRALSDAKGYYAYLSAVPVHDGLSGSPAVTPELIEAAHQAQLTGVFVETRGAAMLLASNVGSGESQALDGQLFFHGL